MAKNQIQKNIDSKIASIQKEISTLETELAKWQKVASDYETNRVTIESILEVHTAPDLAKKPRKPRASKNGGSGAPRG
ncbi:hypothetical protein [Pedobacter steynii]